MNYLRNNDTGAQYNFDSAPMNQNALALDYSSPIEFGGIGKGYRVKGDPYTAILADGRTVRMGGDSEATNKLQMAQLAMEDKRQNLRAGELDIKTKQAQLDGSKRPSAPAGYMWNQDGSGVVKIPGFDGAGNSTEDEKKAAGYALRMNSALETSNQIAKDDPSAVAPGIVEKVASYINEPLANTLRSENRQRIDTANLDALDAALTLSTGAAYTKEQLAGLSKSYFPQISDGDKTIADKNKRFQEIIETAKLRAGRMNPQVNQTINVRAIAEARNAIKQRPDKREQVIQRLIENGIDPQGL